MSRYGKWIEEAGLPAFQYDADHTVDEAAEWNTRGDGRTRRHQHGFGNRRIQAFADNDGTVVLWDELDAMRWLTAPTPNGSGISRIRCDERSWSTLFVERPPAGPHVRTFGPTWFRVATDDGRVAVERTVLCPEGEQPWVLVRVRLTAVGEPTRLQHVEEWALRPRHQNLFAQRDDLGRAAAEAIAYEVEATGATATAREQRAETVPTVVLAGDDMEPTTVPLVIGRPLDVRLEALGTAGVAAGDGAAHPTLTVTSDVELSAGSPVTLWFRFGIDDGTSLDDPEALFDASLKALRERLPEAEADTAPQAAREIPWHIATLTGGACVDGVIGDHALDQASAYSYVSGFNGASRDPFQHALPLVYTEPDLALSVLRNTCSWAYPDGFLPWGLDGEKRVRRGKDLWHLGQLEYASDLHLWAFWLAAEYAAATGDLAAFAAPLPFHPATKAEPVPFIENLRRQFRHFVDEIGLGEHGHVRLLGCDWADSHVGDIAAQGVDRATLFEKGESLLNSAMAAWVLPVFAGLCDRLGEGAMAAEARELGAHLRGAVAVEWNGRWIPRALCGDARFGEDSLFLEVQPWAILSGAVEGDRARDLLREIDERLRHGSPLGARQQWPVPTEPSRAGFPGECLSGGIWFSLNATLTWAAAHVDRQFGWDEWRRMTLANHEEHYPEIWEGTLSGPDAYNSPEARIPGRTWAVVGLGIQSFPVNNLHSHAQPVISYLRMLGVEPGTAGELRVASDPTASFRSRSFEVRRDGSGRLEASGPVVVRTPSQTVEGGPGTLTWSK
ncbi:MAG TPA: hypothetical protein VM938_10900 [Acidimicrobiales bacterium]|nr:hypothetical protein [Acidimicrobiales bacterium]